MSRAPAASIDADRSGPARNEVFLSGRLSAPAEERILPSGDTLVTLRLVVPRVGPRRAGRTGAGTTASKGSAETGARVDTIDVVCWTARTRKAAMRLKAGVSIEVEGALRRRFFGTPGGRQSRYEVEAAALRRLPQGAPPGT
jgi:single-strand DNA-binding protein